MALKNIDLETGWATIQQGIDKVVSFVESNGVKPNQNESLFMPAEYIQLYSSVYYLCLEKGSNYDFELYNRYKHVFYTYINTRVLPVLRERKGEYLLREFVKRWHEHLFMVKCLMRFFFYLDQYFTARHSLPSMKETASLVFLELVCEEMKEEIIGTIVALINEDRDGKPIDGELVKSVIKIFLEFGPNKWNFYQNDFEPQFLDASGAYYDQKSNTWLRELSHSNYTLKVEECLKMEAFKGSQYLHLNTEQKLLERMRHELVESLADKLAKQVNQLELGNNRYLTTQ